MSGGEQNIVFAPPVPSSYHWAVCRLSDGVVKWSQKYTNNDDIVARN
jgi:hypothetical protein